ncbi:unnamed protein product [Amoebophrya sp. A120]|nr:unnamed protein product [Amoebophrya sp. A120]|eukprot:GSA120T00011511001.1
MFHLGSWAFGLDRQRGSSWIRAGTSQLTRSTVRCDDQLLRSSSSSSSAKSERTNHPRSDQGSPTPDLIHRTTSTTAGTSANGTAAASVAVTPVVPVAEQHSYLEDVVLCHSQKQAYEKCFHSWYKHSFLEGNAKDACDKYWAVYEKCIHEHLEKHNLGHLSDLSKPVNLVQDHAVAGGETSLGGCPK